ncbi:hypothetical protein U4E84_05560 [Halorubrum sp. AD140]|uniref:WD40/YVTN/BNR-like repeat-containing protein n=1 Tax=Halorubrum sp. AD140 TaxID=3050073 RepID=UPI002ACC7F09|nr:hypothetical protein [Halorubrum sp. AD140]MDZ5810811.1 hypothetical protein [Halorubrum sp. AD140]
MLLVGSDDGVHAVTDIQSSNPDVAQVQEGGQVMRVETVDAVDGVLAATTTGLYYSLDGSEWIDLDVPAGEVYSVGASTDRLYAGTRPARLYAADLPPNGGLGEDVVWQELDAFTALDDRDDWGTDRHDGVAQVRDVRASTGVSDRLVVAVEVGGVYVSNDSGETWKDRRVTGFDAPHLDDVHHIEVAGSDVWIAATGSGLYRTTDAGQSWTRLDAGHRQTYFRESLAHDDHLYAGGSPSPPGGWLNDRDHALFESVDGNTFRSVTSPTPSEVAVGWCTHGSDAYAVTNRGTLLRKCGEDGTWETVGNVPVAESVHGRTQPLVWFADN